MKWGPLGEMAETSHVRSHFHRELQETRAYCGDISAKLGQISSGLGQISSGLGQISSGLGQISSGLGHQAQQDADGTGFGVALPALRSLILAISEASR